MRNQLLKKLSLSVFVIILLVVCLTVTSLALIFATVNLNDNTIKTGVVSINLNDGNPVITEGEFLLEPGATIQKTFFLKNTGTCSVWYRFYFDNISGNLQDVLEVSIFDGETLLYQGTVAELNKAYSKTAPESESQLEVGETRNFTIRFYLPQEAENDLQNGSLSFDLKADAVQTKNNPQRQFND